MKFAHNGKAPNMTSMRSILLIMVAVAVSAYARADFTGKVVAVIDGDTIDVLADRTKQRVRLAQIDAPESTQAFGTQSRRWLDKRIYGKMVTISTHGRDRYRRVIGSVLLHGRDINLDSVQSGMAWAYLRYVTDPQYVTAETQARAEHRGLWHDTNPTPPWDYRHQH